MGSKGNKCKLGHDSGVNPYCPAPTPVSTFEMCALQREARFPYSSLKGVECQPHPGAKHRALPPVVPRMLTEAPDAARPPTKRRPAYRKPRAKIDLR